MTSQTIKGESFPDFEMLDARIASALRNHPSTCFRQSVSVDEQRASKVLPILDREVELAQKIYGHFQSTRAYDTAQGLSDLFSICSQDDDHPKFQSKIK